MNTEKMPMMIIVMGAAIFVGGIVTYIGASIFWMLDSSGSMGLSEMSNESSFELMNSAPSIFTILITIAIILWVVAFLLLFIPKKETN